MCQKLLGDMVWFAHEGWGLLGDFFDRMMSGAGDISVKAVTWTREMGIKIWENIVQQYEIIRGFIQRLILQIKKAFTG